MKTFCVVVSLQKKYVMLQKKMCCLFFKLNSLLAFGYSSSSLLCTAFNMTMTKAKYCAHFGTFFLFKLYCFIVFWNAYFHRPCQREQLGEKDCRPFTASQKVYTQQLYNASNFVRISKIFPINCLLSFFLSFLQSTKEYGHPIATQRDAPHWQIRNA